MLLLKLSHYNIIYGDEISNEDEVVEFHMKDM